MMHMTFYWGKSVTVLFDFWRTSTWTDYALTLLACSLFSFFYQYLEHHRIQLLNRTATSSSKTTDSTSLTAPLIEGASVKLGGSVRVMRFSSAVLFGVNSAIGYMLMLAVMSFNGGVFVAIVVGLTVGHLVFRSAAAAGVEDAINGGENPCACA
ncbi:hypothetical protein Droror1_Dr00017002 [Drosera rotundifolia]